MLLKLAVVNLELGDVVEAAYISHSLVEALTHDYLLAFAYRRHVLGNFKHQACVQIVYDLLVEGESLLEFFGLVEHYPGVIGETALLLARGLARIARAICHTAS